MIWYLLYPFRGTTEPPSLNPAHPLRCSFTQYGREASRHPAITILISVALATCLIYPFPFLYTNNFTNGASNLPHHVWTAAQPVVGSVDTEPDVAMRSIWVHGSYMKALERDVLQAGLEIQDGLLGRTVNFNPKLSAGLRKDVDQNIPLSLDVRDSIHATNGLSEQSWFFHSPLLYWSCSPDSIAKDNDIVSTINESSQRSTSVNVTLRHSIVFSGKRFENHRLVAADALVITLIHKLDSPVGRQWEKQAQILAQNSTNRWRIYPRDGHVNNSQLYEFKFQPLSLQDDIFLAIAYTITAIYFLLSMTKLRALKSRFGLMLAVVAQIVISVMASFTICAILKIDLSKVPREVYPLVVLAVGLENMFRLVDAVIVTPSQSMTSARIAEALGQTGHVALAGVGQNLFILWFLSKIVAPGVAAFCIFAAVALVVDLLLLLTFFVAVLSVDVRRTELSDSLENANAQHKEPNRPTSSSTNAWVNAVISGKTPTSTRIAGTIVMIGFILVLQWHFFNIEPPLRTLSRTFQLFRPDHQLSSPPSATRLSVDIHQARSPIAWLRMQDHETAREVIQVIKPNSHSYIARVYDPLIFVLESSNRTPTEAGVRRFLPAAYDFARHQSAVFATTIIFVVAAVSLLMNYLLWNEESTSQDDDTSIHNEDPLMTITTLAPGHALDVAMLAASPDGVVASVGLDRRIKIWDLRQKSRTQYIPSTNEDACLFPILAIAIDDQAKWVAFLSATGRLMLWNVNDRQWASSAIVEIEARAPQLFSFKPTKPEVIASLVMVWKSGLLTEVKFGSQGGNQLVNVQLWESPLTCAKQFVNKQRSMQIVSASKRGSLHLASQFQDVWEVEDVPLFILNDDKEVKSVIPLPNTGLLLAVGENTVNLLHIESREILHTFRDLDMISSTLQCLHSVKRNQYCGHDDLTLFSLAYTDRISGALVLRTYSPAQEGDLICVALEKCSTNVTCTAWSEAKLRIYKIDYPGQWQPLPCGAIVGVRKRNALSLFPTDTSTRDSADITPSLRRRGAAIRRTTKENPEDAHAWEAWALSAKGERHTVPLYSADDACQHDKQLFVTTCGPMTRVGRRTLALGFGNTLKIVTVGNERFEELDEGAQDVVLAMAGRRRRGGGGMRGNEMGRS